jgi:hypothetical protein
MKQQNRKEIIRAYKGIKTGGRCLHHPQHGNGKRISRFRRQHRKQPQPLRIFKVNEQLRLQMAGKGLAEYGKDAFVFEVLETLERGDDQAAAQFKEDIQTLQEIWEEKRNTTGQNEQK